MWQAASRAIGAPLFFAQQIPESGSCLFNVHSGRLLQVPFRGLPEAVAMGIISDEKLVASPQTAGTVSTRLAAVPQFCGRDGTIADDVRALQANLEAFQSSAGEHEKTPNFSRDTTMRQSWSDGFVQIALNRDDMLLFPLLTDEQVGQAANALKSIAATRGTAQEFFHRVIERWYPQLA